MYKQDELEFSYGSAPQLYFKPAMNTAKKDSDIIGALAYAWEDGECKFYFADKDDIRRAREASKSKSGPWSFHMPAMVTKTGVRRFCRFLPQSFELGIGVGLDSLSESSASQRLGAWVPALDTTEEQDAAEEEELDDRRAKKRAGGPFPSDVYKHGAGVGYGPPHTTKIVKNELGKKVEDLSPGDECKGAMAVIDAVAAASNEEAGGDAATGDKNAEHHG